MQSFGGRGVDGLPIGGGLLRRLQDHGAPTAGQGRGYRLAGVGDVSDADLDLVHSRVTDGGGDILLAQEERDRRGQQFAVAHIGPLAAAGRNLGEGGGRVHGGGGGGETVGSGLELGILADHVAVSRHRARVIRRVAIEQVIVAENLPARVSVEAGPIAGEDVALHAGPGATPAAEDTVFVIVHQRVETCHSGRATAERYTGGEILDDVAGYGDSVRCVGDVDALHQRMVIVLEAEDVVTRVFKVTDVGGSLLQAQRCESAYPVTATVEGFDLPMTAGPGSVLEVVVAAVKVADVGVARRIQRQRGIPAHLACVIHRLDVPFAAGPSGIKQVIVTASDVRIARLVQRQRSVPSWTVDGDNLSLPTASGQVGVFDLVLAGIAIVADVGRIWRGRLQRQRGIFPHGIVITTPSRVHGRDDPVGTIPVGVLETIVALVTDVGAIQPVEGE